MLGHYRLVTVADERGGPRRAEDAVVGPWRDQLEAVAVELEALDRILEKVGFEADYVHADIGWDFWCKEGDALPPRTVELLKNVDAALFGAITSKPVKAAAAELAPALQDKGLSYRSPIVRMRQLFDLYVCLRPCKAYTGSPLNYREGVDLVVTGVQRKARDVVSPGRDRGFETARPRPPARSRAA